MIATALIAAVNGKHFLFPVSRAPILEIVGLNTISAIVILGANVFLFIFVSHASVRSSATKTRASRKKPSCCACTSS
jgi:hypothetical protein